MTQECRANTSCGRNLDTLFERDIITAHTIIQHRQEALKANQPFSASFGLPVGVLLLGTGMSSARVIARDGKRPVRISSSRSVWVQRRGSNGQTEFFVAL
jgi:hypothetical protein